jgi:uncharacterized membrane protein YfcA
MEYLLLILGTVLASTLTGTVGVGGALIIVPGLTVAAASFALLPAEIRFIGYTMNFISLAPIVFKNRSKIDLHMAWPLVLFAVLGALLGANAPKVVDEGILLQVFVVVLIAIILLMVKKIFDHSRSVADFTHNRRSWTIISCIGLIVGLASGLFGIGGGVFMMPLVMLLLGIKPKSIILVTPLIVLFSTGTGIVVSLWNGLEHLHGVVAVVVIASAILGAELGDRLRGRMSDNLLQWMIVAVLVVLTVKMGLKAAAI